MVVARTALLHLILASSLLPPCPSSSLHRRPRQLGWVGAVRSLRRGPGVVCCAGPAQCALHPESRVIVRRESWYHRAAVCCTFQVTRLWLRVKTIPWPLSALSWQVRWPSVGEETREVGALYRMQVATCMWATVRKEPSVEAQSARRRPSGSTRNSSKCSQPWNFFTVRFSWRFLSTVRSRNNVKTVIYCLAYPEFKYLMELWRV